MGYQNIPTKKVEFHVDKYIQFITFIATDTHFVPSVLTILQFASVIGRIPSSWRRCLIDNALTQYNNGPILNIMQQRISSSCSINLILTYRLLLLFQLFCSIAKVGCQLRIFNKLIKLFLDIYHSYVVLILYYKETANNDNVTKDSVKNLISIRQRQTPKIHQRQQSSTIKYYKEDLYVMNFDLVS